MNSVISFLLGSPCSFLPWERRFLCGYVFVRGRQRHSWGGEGEITRNGDANGEERKGLEGSSEKREVGDFDFPGTWVRSSTLLLFSMARSVQGDILLCHWPQ